MTMARIGKSKSALVIMVLVLAVLLIPALASARLVDWWELLILLIMQDCGRDLLDWPGL